MSIWSDAWSELKADFSKPLFDQSQLDWLVPDHPTGGVWNNQDRISKPGSFAFYVPGDNGIFQGGVSPNSGNAGISPVPQQIEYFDAPYAEMYGMSAETAYQEALANTAYQRKVKDLKAAGLNPVLGINGAGSAAFGGSLASTGSAGSSGSGKDVSAVEWTDALPYFGAAAGAAIALASKWKAPYVSLAANTGYNALKGLSALID